MARVCLLLLLLSITSSSISSSSSSSSSLSSSSLLLLPPCPSGCCPFAGWFCCPDNDYCAADPDGCLKEGDDTGRARLLPPCRVPYLLAAK